jgi:hypothetical protein
MPRRGRGRINLPRTTTTSIAAFLLCCCCLASASAAQPAAAATPNLAHGNKSKSKAKVALPVCATGASRATTTYSCNTYGQNICDIATGQCCNSLSSPSDKGGCGLVTREELSEFESEVVDVTTTLANENAVMQATIGAIAATLTQIASQLPPNTAVTPPPSPNYLCTRQLEYPDGVPAIPPFFTTAFTNFQIVPLDGKPIECNDEAIAAFVAAVTAEAPKPDSCPLVPKPGGGEYPKIRPREIRCMDMGPDYGLPRGKSLWFSMTMSWQTRFPCPASPFARITAPTTPSTTPLFDFSGCERAKACNPCRPATGDGPSAEAICQAIYSRYPPNTVEVTSSMTYLLRQSACEACVAKNDPYCSPDNNKPYIVG